MLDDNSNTKLSLVTETEKEEEDKTFNKLVELQILLKKESALKELFIRTSNEINSTDLLSVPDSSRENIKNSVHCRNPDKYSDQPKEEMRNSEPDQNRNNERIKRIKKRRAMSAR